MGAKATPAPEGFEVVKLGRDWVILITPRDDDGNLLKLGYVTDPNGEDRQIPLTYRRRAAAVSDAYVKQLVAENEALRRRVAAFDASEASTLAAVGL